MTPLDRLRLERGAEYLHALGARAIAEALAEIARHADCVPFVLDLLDGYRRHLTPELLRTVGGDRFPPRPLHEVPR